MATLEPLRELFRFGAYDGHAVSAIHLLSPSQLVTAGTTCLPCMEGGCQIRKAGSQTPGANGDVTLWRLDEEEESGRRSAHFRGHRAPVVCLDGDGEKIISGARPAHSCALSVLESSPRVET